VTGRTGQGRGRRAERVLILNWRDEAHPEGGGSEVYIERIGEHLVREGREVTIVCSHHSDAAREEVLPSGVRVLRRGRRFSVYPYALAALTLGRLGRLGRPDVVVDVQNGVPFWVPLVSRRPVVVLCHHVHREQWSVVFGPAVARLGWWLESVVAPRVYRRKSYVTVSQVSRRELEELGVDGGRITVVHNGVDDGEVDDTPVAPVVAGAPVVEPEGGHTLLVLGRLVPHKRVEIAVDTLLALRERHPGLRLVVAGHGYWHDQLARHVAEAGLGDEVELAGYVTPERRTELLRRSSVLLVPSLKEGWGLTVMEAAAHGTPAVGFADAGGVAESVVDGVTGLLARDPDDFAAQVGRLLDDPALRARLGEAARLRSHHFHWSAAAQRFGRVLDAVAQGRLPDEDDLRRSPDASEQVVSGQSVVGRVRRRGGSALSGPTGLRRLVRR
jgi:glycosyltransferase involved in cell wall biosynthesis